MSQQQLQLLSKITIGGQELSNRVVLAPLTRGRYVTFCLLNEGWMDGWIADAREVNERLCVVRLCIYTLTYSPTHSLARSLYKRRCYRGTPTDDPFDPKSRIPNEDQALYYEQRASGGLLITEATAFNEEGYGWIYAPQLQTPDQVDGWRKVTDRVHAKGGKIYVQLWHMGRQAHSSFHPTTNRIVSASNLPMTGGAEAKTIHRENVQPEIPVSMSIEDIQSTIRDFVKGAHNARAAGFDGIELHAANGYLLDQFLQSVSNIRTDVYGGSKENRLRFLREVIEAIIESGAYPANRIGFRISPNGSFGGMGSSDNFEMFTYVAQELNKYGLAYIHVMDGTGFGYHGKDKIVTLSDIRKVWDSAIIANVGLTKEIAEGLIRSGAADLAAFGRLYMSNPDLPERFANDWPLEEVAPYETWWQPIGSKGYTDWKPYTPPKNAKKDGDHEVQEEKKE